MIFITGNRNGGAAQPVQVISIESGAGIRGLGLVGIGGKLKC